MTEGANRLPVILPAARHTSTTQFVELHARSAFSFLEGSSLPEELAVRCAELGITAMALSDAHGVYGAPRFHMAARKLGVRALLGAEAATTDGSRYTLLAKNRQGYHNLCRLITRTKLRDRHRGKPENPVATQNDFAEFAKGLICLTGGTEGPLARVFSEHRGSAARQGVQKQVELLIRIFGKENVFVELQRHHRRKQEVRNQALVELARSMRLPLLATNGVTHAIAAKRKLQDVLTCVKYKTTISEAGRLLSYNAECHLKSSAEMNRLFADLPEAIAHTGELASRLSFTLEDLGYEFPHYPVPAGETEISFLRKRTDEGARRRYQPYSDKARRQIERELALIGKLKLAGLFPNRLGHCRILQA